MLILDKQRACVLLSYDLEKGIANVILPRLISGETQMTIKKLESEYTGAVIIIKPEYNFNNRKRSKSRKSKRVVLGYINKK